MSEVDSVDNTNYLPVAAIYGPNGGGKSNVIEAFYFLEINVLTPPRLDKKEFPLEDGSAAQSNAAQKKHFIFDHSGAELPSSFEVIFRVAGYEYKYILKIKDGLIAKENLYATDTQRDVVVFVFERTKDYIKLGELLDGAQTEKLNPAMPLIQYLSTTYDFDITRNAIYWLIKTRTVKLLMY